MAGFAEARYSFSDSVRVTAGVRYTKDRKRMNQLLTFTNGPVTADPGGMTSSPFLASKSFSKLTFNAGAEADLTDAMFAYAKVSRGFKAGGFDETVLGNSFGPETLTSYEAGVKGRLLDRRVNYALSAFYSKYKDMQVSVVEPGALGFSTDNAASSTIWGFDFQGKAALGYGFSIDTSFSYIPKASYDSYKVPDPFGVTCGNTTTVCELAGNRLNRAPRFNGTAGLNYEQDLGDGRKLTVRGEVYHTSRINYSAYGYSGAVEPAYTLLNAYFSADLTSQMSVRLYGKNLTDKLYLAGRVPNSTAGFIFGYYGRPREFGTEINLKF